MAALKPWYKVVTPREDLREGKPLDASEFAVHLDQVRDGRAPDDYQNPERFFERTYLTENLKGLASEVVRRLSGVKTETSAVFNMATQFGGGKTHALTLLYHLARAGNAAQEWRGIRGILTNADVGSIPKSETAVFVGTEFDSITGRGGEDGTPLRKTPWGEIAYQIGGKEAFDVVAKHEEAMTAPSGEVIRAFLPKDRPCLILIDELMNYISRSRKMGMAAQTYSFLHNLSEEVRGQDRVVLVVSIPASEMEMNAEDQSEYNRCKKLLDRLGKPVIMSAEAETSEIIRRRLFEWGGIPDDGKKVINEYADWLVDHRQSLPSWFPVDNAREQLAATYPFHPSTISVFERKWQALPRFQQTRGILRLLALWVAKTYEEGFKGAHKDPMIGLGTAPLDDPLFRAAVFEQLGESRLEGAVTTDICGKSDSNAIRLDKEATDAIKKARLHRKVATTIFFESNGGQLQSYTTMPEMRLAVSEPDLDIANVETVVDALVPPDGACYFLDNAKNRYWFSIKPNLNKLLSDRRASVQAPQIEERAREEIRKVFSVKSGIVDCQYFPEKSNQVPDRPFLTLAILSPEHCIQNEEQTQKLVEAMTREHGTSSRTFKNALIWCVPESSDIIAEEARKLLAWEAISEEKKELRLDEGQQGQLSENLRKARRDLKESVWRVYKNVMLLTKGNVIRKVDLGLVHSSNADSIAEHIIDSLRKEDEVTEYIQPRKLLNNWPPAFTEWSTKQVRDSIFASPEFSRLLNPDSVKQTIARGVAAKMIAYVGKDESGGYDPFIYGEALDPIEIDMSDDSFIITSEEAKKHIEPPQLTSIRVTPANIRLKPGKKQTFVAKGFDQHDQDFAVGKVEWKSTCGDIDEQGVLAVPDDEGSFVVEARSGEITGSAAFTVAKPGERISGEDGDTQPSTQPDIIRTVRWHGTIPLQKWMNFYTKVLSKHAAGKSITVTLDVEISPEGGVPEQQIEDIKMSLRDLGLDDEITKS